MFAPAAQVETSVVEEVGELSDHELEEHDDDNSDCEQSGDENDQSAEDLEQEVDAVSSDGSDGHLSDLDANEPSSSGHSHSGSDEQQEGECIILFHCFNALM